MSGLFERTKPAGRDGVRYARSKHIGDIDDASVIYGSSRVSTDRSFHLLRPASSWAIRRAISSGTPISDQMGMAANEAARQTARAKRDKIGQADLSEALSRLEMTQAKRRPQI
jgi:hypothetical protein